MIRCCLITGGARSGKSAIAEARVLALAAQAQGTALYIATAQAYDDEMRARIAAHQARRGPEWHTVHAPLDLVTALAQADGRPTLVDCLTLWLSNLMLAGHDWRDAAQALLATLAQHDAPVVFVTNEVGMGIVPENALARAFRDAAGTLNQMIASHADEVTLAVSGLPLRVK
ncbi:bifunctional adenosylcobinamide kinase/adenosylcobinamide-phosphate guanylyltransferase [Thioclava sp. SK-1]|uniref:bifunctional adenosylcobinamide kinase/adenosylcobinamide-phosphate guanylyltransferase n=1 Tax=Thioclava sp. SK-1 TaxID=1889770 RepID=UPI0008254EE9|nr:bifunctional adenosylcobinamide kinase/adenosylcobinamide-phosphate guanylyltransferase [Thioclava sp. SK-1]OCX65976.1 bifunctional adenosylcobinamide kinase/adenosylcobinamide-phosphate guanylyltransferase [Thioclava sp. SK-1]